MCELDLTPRQVNDLESGKRKIYKHPTLKRHAVVDTELSEEWLDKLNELHTMKLMNICYGHVIQNYTTQPDLVLIPKEEYIKEFLSSSLDIVVGINEKEYNAEIRVFTFKRRNNGPNHRDIIGKVNLHITPSNICEANDLVEKNKWFSEIVQILIEFDTKINLHITKEEVCKYNQDAQHLIKLIQLREEEERKRYAKDTNGIIPSW